MIPASYLFKDIYGDHWERPTRAGREAGDTPEGPRGGETRQAGWLGAALAGAIHGTTRQVTRHA